MPKPYPQEFRDDVVRVARNREPGVTIEQTAADFGVHPMTLTKWLRRVAVEDGERPGTTRAASEEVRELRRRNRLLEQEVEVLRRAAAYLSQANLPGKGSTRSERARCGRDPRRGDVPGVAACPPALLPMAGEPDPAKRGGARASGERAVRRAPR
ncbi:transposase-like protein [Curtobacterium pusillum]|uniref:Transposase-like protein n=1 Tax=Curtobacterium pusillum TaxID=69373 RepID=A0AAW3TAQ4_9MICO|nr:transposase-like protein [Curtobacterium pusillum]